MKLGEPTRGEIDLGNLRGRMRMNIKKVHCKAFSNISKRKDYTIIIEENSNMLFFFICGERMSKQSVSL